MRFAALPGSSLEADEVEKMWRRRSARGEGVERGALKLTGADASEAAFKRSAPGRQVLHLATHGFTLQDSCLSGSTGAGGEERGRAGNPLLLAGLALAGANRRDEARARADEEDGILTAEEIASLDLRGVEWAVLSGCETGVGPVQTGEGVLGLRRAFEVAGAGTLVMSLWPVSDNDALAWIRRLYSGRLGGMSTAEAVRDAGVGMIEARRRAGAVTHPFYWGAFVAAGDWE
jgi:CHAT domain-containing protein